MKKNLRGRSPSGKFARQPCKDYLEGLCTESPCNYWHSPECQFYKSDSGCKFGDKCSFGHRQVEGQPSKKTKQNGDKSAVGVLQDARQLGCVFQDTEPPESLPIVRKGTKVLGPSRRVRFTEATQSCKHPRKQRKVRRSENVKSKFFISEVRTL